MREDAIQNMTCMGWYLEVELHLVYKLSIQDSLCALLLLFRGTGAMATLMHYRFV